MRYCSECGSARLARSTPYGEIGLRYVCQECRVVHYSKHSMVAGCVATWQGRILLCQRSIEPYRGLWTIPGGYMEIGETLQEAAARETLEEAHGEVSGLELLALYNLPMFSEVYALFSAQLSGPKVWAGEESSCAELVEPKDIDWPSLAFPMVREALRHWMRPRGTPVDLADFLWGPDGGVRVRRRSLAVTNLPSLSPTG